MLAMHVACRGMKLEQTSRGLTGEERNKAMAAGPKAKQAMHWACVLSLAN